MLATRFHAELSQAEVGTCAMLFKQLVEFDSPRVMIQEVQSFQAHLGLLSPEKHTLANQMGDGSTQFVDEYFGRSVVLFRDDSGFMNQMRSLFEEDLPLEVKEQLVSLYLDELTYDLGALEDRKEQSVTLQKKCSLLYLLALLGRNDADLSR